MDNDKYKKIFWEEKSNAKANRIVAELEHYCDKYGVQLYDRPLNFEFVVELIEKIEISDMENIAKAMDKEEFEKFCAVWNELHGVDLEDDCK